ncbi:MAG: hypothetical protein ABJA67_05770 [Chthonomonadales bacterium]
MFKDADRKRGSVAIFALGVALALSCIPSVSIAQVQNETPPPNEIEKKSLELWGGKKAQGFKLASADGKMVDISKDLGKKPIILVFYRGVW